MPSDHSSEIEKLCRHQSWRIGCLSCKQQHTKRQCEEAETKRKKVRDDVATIDTLISNESDMDKRKSLKEEKKELEGRLNVIKKLLESLNAARASTVKEVQKICAENEPDMLAEAFENDAAVHEQELLNIWRAGASTAKQMEFPKFKTEDPSRRSSFKGLDRTKIPASPDYLINSPIGLEIFLRLSKNRQPSNPMSAVGLSPGPAFMSYGSAVAKYGPPEAPGEDWPSEDQIDTAPEVLSVSADGPAPTSLDSSWELFTENRFLNYTALLVAQYAKLVREKST